MEQIAVTKITKKPNGEVIETRDMTLDPRVWKNICKRNQFGNLVEFKLRATAPTFEKPKELIKPIVESVISDPKQLMTLDEKKLEARTLSRMIQVEELGLVENSISKSYFLGELNVSEKSIETKSDEEWKTIIKEIKTYIKNK